MNTTEILSQTPCLSVRLPCLSGVPSGTAAGPDQVSVGTPALLQSAAVHCPSDPLADGESAGVAGTA